MSDTCRNGHERTQESTYIYPAREGRKPRITCRTCRDGEPQASPSQEERVAAIAAREVAKLLPKKLNEFGELRFWGMCRGISLERYPLRMAWLMAQLRPELVQDIREAADLLERGIYVFDVHDGDLNRIRARMSTPEPHQEKEDEHHA
jgi:hypothetical protein